MSDDEFEKGLEPCHNCGHAREVHYDHKCKVTDCTCTTFEEPDF